MNLTKTIRSAVDSNNVILGTKNTLNHVMTNKAKFVVYAQNCEKESKADLIRFSDLSGAELHEFDGSSVELGEVCGKPFVVSMLVILEEAEVQV